MDGSTVTIVGVCFVVWLLAGVIAGSREFARFQRSYPLIALDTYKKDVCFFWFVVASGPISLVTSLCWGRTGQDRGLLFPGKRARQEAARLQLKAEEDFVLEARHI